MAKVVYLKSDAFKTVIFKGINKEQSTGNQVVVNLRAEDENGATIAEANGGFSVTVAQASLPFVKALQPLDKVQIYNVRLEPQLNGFTGGNGTFFATVDFAAVGAKVEETIKDGSNALIEFRRNSLLKGFDPALKGVFKFLDVSEHHYGGDNADLQGQLTNYDIEVLSADGEQMKFRVPVEVYQLHEAELRSFSSMGRSLTFSDIVIRPLTIQGTGNNADRLGLLYEAADLTFVQEQAATLGAEKPSTKPTDKK